MDRIRDGFKKSILMMSAFSLFMLPIMQFGGEWIIKIFVDDPEVVYYGALSMRITSYFYIFLGLIYMTRGVLNGVGDAMFALINGVVEVIGRITIPIFLTMIPFIGVWGIWWATALTWLISAVFCVWRYISWRKKNMITAYKMA